MPTETDPTLADPADGPAWFDRWVDTYDRDRRVLLPCFDAFYGTAAEVAALGRSGPVRVLDLGAGTGLLTASLIDSLPEATFVLLDEAPAMLDQAAERLAPLGDRVSTVVADLRDPLPDGGFDVIASALAIHHLADEAKADLYGRCAAALTPGGVLVNAEQVAGPTPGLDAAAARMAIDLPASVADQLAMFRDAGLVDVDCVFRHWRFAVLAGWKPGT